jgi:hypothetical protein
VPFASPAQQRWANAEAARGNESVASFASHGNAYMRESKKKDVKHGPYSRHRTVHKAQPRFGGSVGAGRRMQLEDVEKLSGAKPAMWWDKNWKKTTAAMAGAGAVGGSAYYGGRKGARSGVGKAMTPPDLFAALPKAKKAVRPPGSGYHYRTKSGHRAEFPRSEVQDLQVGQHDRPNTTPLRRPPDLFGKREYDPETARHRREGMYTAGLLGGGGVATGYGVRGARRTTKALKSAQKLRPGLEGAMAANKKSLGLIGGGIGALTGAGLLQQHYQHRGHRYN